MQSKTRIDEVIYEFEEKIYLSKKKAAEKIFQILCNGQDSLLFDNNLMDNIYLNYDKEKSSSLTKFF